MPKLISTYVCQQCGYKSSQYLGKCPQCDSWNSFVEEIEESESQKSQRSQRFGKVEIVNLAKLKNQKFDRLSSRIDEFDRVLGGGIVPGSLVLLAGDPGIGKSTLLTQLALNINENVIARSVATKQSKKEIASLPSVARNDGGGVLYVAGEESAQQIKIRVDRIRKDAKMLVLNETDVDLISASIEAENPKLVIIDSIQTIETQDLESVPGSVGQVRESASRLQRLAKNLHIPIILVGHVTKEGTVAGPKTLEHMVDVVLSLEGDTQNQYRILRGLKNRFGPTDEVGVFEMVENGMIQVKNPSKLFLEERVNAPGSAVVPILTGLRPILVEIQALVTKTSLPSPRRTASGVDNNRLQLLVAVLQKRLGLPLYDQDVFVNVTGGIKVWEPAADLAICMAIISSCKDVTLPPKTVFIGEVGLLGEVRVVRGLDKRTTEAKKLGFINVISSEKAKSLSQAVRLSIKV